MTEISTEEDDIYDFKVGEDLTSFSEAPMLNIEENKEVSEEFPEQQGRIERPMTSVAGAGYKDPQHRSGMDTKNVPGGRSVQPLKRRSDDSPEYKAVEMEREVNRLYEGSASDYVNGNYMLALEKSKDSLKSEVKLCKFQEEININDHNIDLTFAINYNTSHMYYVNGMFTEALEAFKKIVKNKQFQQIGGGRLRVNIGNIYFEKHKFHDALKNYKMALDQILPSHHKNLRSSVLKNIGICYFKLQQYKEAAKNFDEAFNSNGDITSCYNLVLCHYALNIRKLMKKSFVKLLTAKIPGLREDEELDSSEAVDDELVVYFKEKRRRFFELILKAARLIADQIEDNWEKGYDFLIDKLRAFQLKYETSELSSEMEMEKALKYLKNKQFKQAIESLKAFEKKGKKLQAKAATNLSFIYILEGNIKLAEKYAKVAIDCDSKYNAKALVNQGICYFYKKKFRAAKDYFSRALIAEPDCVDAIYNIGLVDKVEFRFKESLRTFQRLLQFIPDSIEVIYQIADLHEKLEDLDSANEWFNRLITRVPSDPGALFSLGAIYERDNDEANSFNYFLESHKYYPVNIDVVRKLGFYFVQNDIYEKALEYFERAAQIKPREVEWKLYVGSCLRRIGQYRKAFECYRKIHKNFPENLECLEYLIQISGELGKETERKHFIEKKNKIEKKLEKLRNKLETKVLSKEEQEKKKREQMEEEARNNDSLQKETIKEKKEMQEEVQKFKEIKKVQNKKNPKVNLYTSGQLNEGIVDNNNDTDDVFDDIGDNQAADLLGDMFK